MSAEGIDRPSETGVRSLFGNADYLRIWVLGGFTGFIRWFQLLALGVYTFEITGSPLLVSVVPVLWGLPLALCGPLIGGIADRVNRKALLSLSLGAILTVAVTMAAFAYGGELGFAHVAVASVMSGLFWATDLPLRRRLLGDAAGANLSAAMSLDSATNSATRMAGPFMGGVMLQVFGIGGVYALSAAVYAAGLLLILTARLPAQIRHGVTPPLVRGLIAGVRFALANWELRRVLVVTVVFNIFGFPVTAMIPILGREQLGLSPALVGFLSSLEGAGAFAGGVALAMLAKPSLYGRIFVGGASLQMTLVLYLSVLAAVSGGPYHSFFAAALTLAAIGTVAAGFAAMQSTLTYLYAGPEYRSRVLGVLTLCIGTGPIGFLNVGWMAESFGLPTALAVMALEGLFVMLVLWVYGVLDR